MSENENAIANALRRCTACVGAAEKGTYREWLTGMESESVCGL